ncbi:MAG: hypothetical protein PVF20_03860 [Desulfobacterales bacterium]|jgi:hypothetical protein
MDARKKKKIEEQLRRLIQAAEKDLNSPSETATRPSGTIQVIRRRKGSPTRHLRIEHA